ncbi:MAG TPA: hypothetical protein VHC47_07705 [Mucilaginibacter sp.]|nr:hypothetical protein [Mucilaginibacter sp.]
MERRNTTGSNETDIEFCCLQIRKMLELISLGSLVMHKNEFEKQSEKYKTFWNPKRILEDIEKINPDFYPKPICIDLKNSTPQNTILYDMKDGFLKKSDFVTMYNECSKILHNENPYGAKTNYEHYRKHIKKWGEEIIYLLKLHMIKLYKGDGFYLVYVYNASDENIHAVHYPSSK